MQIASERDNYREISNLIFWGCEGVGGGVRGNTKKMFQNAVCWNFPPAC